MNLIKCCSHTHEHTHILTLVHICIKTEYYRYLLLILALVNVILVLFWRKESIVRILLPMHSLTFKTTARNVRYQINKLKQKKHTSSQIQLKKITKTKRVVFHLAIFSRYCFHSPFPSNHIAAHVFIVFYLSILYYVRFMVYNWKIETINHTYSKCGHIWDACQWIQQIMPVNQLNHI